MNAGGPAVVASDIRKSYGDLRAVDGVSFSVDEGEFFGLLGPNGAGKSTTLEIVEGLRKPDSGSVRLLGESPWPRNPTLLRKIGVQLQASSFFERLTSKEQLETFGALYGISKSKAVDMLELVGLTDKADVQDTKLSGGQRQRLSIACALVHDPEIVFLDEPTAALDPQARRNLWDVLRAIQARGKTIIYTTHHLDEAEILCDRVAIIDSGRIMTMGAPAQLVRALDTQTQVIIEHGVVPARLVSMLPGAESVVDDGVSVTISTSDAGVTIKALGELDALSNAQVRTATLEDVFLHLTGRAYRE
ncbi:ABC transporter ATP-binding protein [Lentzea sp. NPDC058450]|uniref:ABC transporter ATP-binding protein n=1 Tax=Lentzea sp. NPDC058450 TaxID=3346505 RepID=UPI00366A4687